MILFNLLQFVTYNTEMKRTSKTVNVQKQQKNSDVDMDCSCEILYDTSLSNVGDSDCDCSDCLQANLNAFNEFKITEQNTNTTTRQNINKNRGQSANSASQKIQNNKQRNKIESSQTNLQRYKSTDRYQQKNTKTLQKWGVENQNQQRNDDNFDEFQQNVQFSNGQLNDFLLITKHRTRKYLEQRKKMEQYQKKQKEQLKEKIKKNLQILKYTAQIVRDQQKVEQDEIVHPYKWNHQKYKCQCNGTIDREANKNCCRRKQRKYDGPSYEQIVKQAKQKRLQKQKQRKEQKCVDLCANHHNRTDKQKIEKIKKFIQKNVKKYRKQKKRFQKQKEDKQKTKQGKLKAIDIKSRQILSRSKKYDDNVSRTSFRLSIQQFDTFSELRQQNMRRKQLKQNQRDIQNKIKNGGGQLLEKVYQDVDENMDEFQLNMSQKPKQIKKTTKQDMPQLRKDDKIYQRIAYDAQLKIPKNIKNKVIAKQSNAYQQQGKRTKQKKGKQVNRKQSNLNTAKQQNRKRKIEQEIERKKMQIIQQFKKRNSNKPDNSQMRKQYQQKLQNEKKTIRNKQYLQSQSKTDPYRANYPTKPGKNAKQIEIHGDPLLQQYTYHQNKQKARQKNMTQKGDMGIFTENVHSLTSKTRLKP